MAYESEQSTSFYLNTIHYNIDAVLKYAPVDPILLMKTLIVDLESIAPNIGFFVSAQSYKAMIIDYSRIEAGYISEKDLADENNSKKITVTCSGSCELAITNQSFYYYKMPFDVERIINHIEQ